MLPGASIYAVYLGTLISTAIGAMKEEEKKKFKRVKNIAYVAFMLGIFNIIGFMTGLIMSYEYKPSLVVPMMLLFTLLECVNLGLAITLFMHVKMDLGLSIASIVLISLSTLLNIMVTYFKWRDSRFVTNDMNLSETPLDSGLSSSLGSSLGSGLSPRLSPRLSSPLLHRHSRSLPRLSQSYAL